jgi:hypothetical protein
MKLTKPEKNLRKIMKAGFMDQGGELFSNETAGMTVAVRPICGSDSKFCEVSLAFCDFEDDTFNRKRGEFVVLQKWEQGNFVTVPIFGEYDLEPLNIANMFFEMFGE